MTPEEKEKHFQEMKKLLGEGEPTGNVVSITALRRAKPEDGPNAIGTFGVLLQEVLDAGNDPDLKNKRIQKHLENKSKL